MYASIVICLFVCLTLFATLSLLLNLVNLESVSEICSACDCCGHISLFFLDFVVSIFLPWKFGLVGAAVARQSCWQHPPWRVVLHRAARPASLRAHQHLQVSVLLMLPGVTVLLPVLVSNFYILKALDTLKYMLGCLGVSVIHQTQTRTIGSLACVCDVVACVYTLGTLVHSLCCRVCTECVWLQRNLHVWHKACHVHFTHPCGDRA